MNKIKKWFLYSLDLGIIISFFSILLILLSGGIKIKSIGFAVDGFSRPCILFGIFLLIRKVFYGRAYDSSGLIGKLILFVENYPIKRTQVFVFLISMCLFLIIDFRVLPKCGLTGDEPHFLIITSSIVKDGDLNLKNNYSDRNYSDFYQYDLPPHSKVCNDTKIYSAHSIGLPVLMIPGYYFAGRYGASYTMMILFSLLTVVMFSICYSVTKKKILSLGLSFLMAFTIPIVLYSAQLYAETPAAVIVALISAFLLGENKAHARRSGFVFVWILIAFLPWIHVRYIYFSIIFLVLAGFKYKTKDIAPAIVLSAISVLTLLFYMRVFYGEYSLTAQYHKIDAGARYFIKGLMGNFIDSRFGLLLYSPFYIFMAAGAYVFYKREKKLFFAWSVLVVPFIIGISLYGDWYGGMCPPLRYMLPVVPLFIVPLGILCVNCKDKIFYAIFCGLVCLSLLVKNMIVENPLLMYNDPAEKMKLLEYISKKYVDITFLFPTLFNPSTNDCWKIAGWIVFLFYLSIHGRKYLVKSAR